MRVDVVTIFPEYLAPLDLSLIGKARSVGALDVAVHDLRAWTHDVHRTVDDTPYGGGPGMVMRPEPWGEALDALAPPGAGGDRDGPAPRLVVPTPAGVPFTQAMAGEFAAEGRLIFACGRYEGIDQRVLDHAATRMPVTEVSLGDYVLFGGEVAVLVILEAVTRLLPGVLGGEAAAERESFAAGLLEPPQYTRPEEFRGARVPDVLLSGDHARVARWRREQALWMTWRRRPELLAEASLTDEERRLIERFERGEAPAAPARGERDEGHGRDSHR
jgi:tRNA (guanine37-N1)-methyltransferase